ncbi:MAG TPA: SRPBCC family protein [Solirubrobacterales bacterium]|nr:SRPBCC family protein [Solirubrobacterales bacterium]
MPTAADAVLEERDGRPALRFERVLPHPPERVWRALTEPAEEMAWHPTPARFEPRTGGRVVYVPGGHIAELPDGEVTDYDPPRLLGYTWTADGAEFNHLRFEIRPHDAGSVLILVHTFEDRLKAARDSAGWHVCLANLAESLGGADSAPEDGPRSSGQWAELNSSYQRKFGISPEEATPPPRRD